MTVSIQVPDLKINKLTKAQFESLDNPSPTELYFVIDEGEEGTVDQTYNPLSSNAQSGTAVAEAISSVGGTVDQTYNPNSTNAQSGTAVAEAISSVGGTVDQTYNPTSTNAQSGVAIAGAGFQTVQEIQRLSTGAIPLVKEKSIYILTVNAPTTITFDTTNMGTLTSSQSYTFELHLEMYDAVYSLDFSSIPNLSWQDGEAPNLSETGYYRLAFQTIDGGISWNGNLQGVW